MAVIETTMRAVLGMTEMPKAKESRQNSVVGVAVVIGAGLGMTVGVIVGGGVGIALGAGAGGGLGVVFGAAWDA